MSFEHPCFISYTAGRHRLMPRFVGELYRSLCDELDTLQKKQAFFAKEDLEGGALSEKEMGVALCGSVCLVMVYTPRYFDDEDTFCTREFRGMELLEQHRFRALGIGDTSTKGLIVPVIFRGADQFPPEIRERRQYHRVASPDCCKSWRVAPAVSMPSYAVRATFV